MKRLRMFITVSVFCSFVYARMPLSVRTQANQSNTSLAQRKPADLIGQGTCTAATIIKEFAMLLHDFRVDVRAIAGPFFFKPGMIERAVPWVAHQQRAPAVQAVVLQQCMTLRDHAVWDMLSKILQEVAHEITYLADHGTVHAAAQQQWHNIMARAQTRLRLIANQVYNARLQPVIGEYIVYRLEPAHQAVVRLVQTHILPAEQHLLNTVVDAYNVPVGDRSRVMRMLITEYIQQDDTFAIYMGRIINRMQQERYDALATVQQEKRALSLAWVTDFFHRRSLNKKERNIIDQLKILINAHAQATHLFLH